MALTSSGDALAAGVLLGLAALDVAAGAAAVLAGLAVAGRWGSSSLGALAGGQAVLGPAGWTGPAALAASSWAASAALVLACPPGRFRVVAFGLTAAALVAGPPLDGGAAAVALRVVAAVAGVAAAAFTARAVPRPAARRGAVVAGIVSVALAFTP
jgi:hypothetical protein